MKTTNEYLAEYRLNNKEKISAQRKLYYDKIKTKPWFREYKKTPEYKARHLAEAKDYASRNVERLKAYRASNSAARSARSSAWNAANREHRKAYMSAYQKANPEKFYEACMMRRAKMYGTSTIGDRKAIVEWMKSWRVKDAVTCKWCGGTFRGIECHADHVIPLKLDGPHALENLAISCAPCNRKKNKKHPDDFTLVD